MEAGERDGLRGDFLCTEIAEARENVNPFKTSCGGIPKIFSSYNHLRFARYKL